MKSHAVGIMLVAALLGGCSILHSEAPLIARSDPAIGLTPGLYQPYEAFEPGAVPAPKRARCIDPGYAVAETDRLGWPTGRRLSRVYCPLTPAGDAPPLRIDAAENGMVLNAPPDSGEAGQGESYRMRFEALGRGFRIAQFSHAAPAPPDAVGRGAFYYLIRDRGADVEIHMVPCDDGTRLASGEAATIPPRRHRKPERPAAPPPRLKCTLTSLDAARPDMLDYAALGDAAPEMILRRIGD